MELSKYPIHELDEDEQLLLETLRLIGTRYDVVIDVFRFAESFMQARTVEDMTTILWHLEAEITKNHIEDFGKSKCKHRKKPGKIRRLFGCFTCHNQ
mgnify:CR=1 FL=1